MGNSKLFGRQSPVKRHLVRGKGGLAGEIEDLRDDIDSELDRWEREGGYFVTQEFTDPDTADVDGIKESFSSSDSELVFGVDDLDGAVGAGEMDPPRNITITSSSSADITAVDVAVVGKAKNQYGEEVDVEDEITVTNAGDATDAGTKAFTKVTQVTIPAMDGSGGSLQIGFGAVLGLSHPIRERAGTQNVLHEISDGSTVTNGTFTSPGTNDPNGTYTPNSAPDGSTSYAVTYEVDSTVDQ